MSEPATKFQRIFAFQIAVQVTLIGAIAGAQWTAITWMMAHWKP